MESIFATLIEEVNTLTVSKFLMDTEEVFSNGASKLGLSNLKAIRELCVKEGEQPLIIAALDSFIKSIKNKKFEDSKSARKAVEEIMKILYPISEDEESDEESERSSREDDSSSNEDSEIDESDEESERPWVSREDETDDEKTDEEEIEEDEIERYNELLKDKVLKKYIVTKRFKITTSDEEKRDMIESLYKIVKNIYENFASDKDADKILSVLEELDELRD
uniref:Uncharacterized protein n=1 Tax=viral metagenome TaxID=1070528 RepID=A0A6C0DM57_9ZZZZ